MTTAISGNRWRGWTHPITVGAVVGLLTGLLGLIATTIAYSTVAGGFAGAVGCGITVAYRSDEELSMVVTYAVIADVASSIAFFLLVLAAYLTSVWLAEGISFLGVIWFSVLYLVFGGLAVAVPVALVSLGITSVAAAVTSLLKGRMTEPTPP